MEKKFLFAALFSFALALVPAAGAYAGQISVTFNGRPVAFPDQGPVIVDGRTMVPVGPVIDAINPGNDSGGLLSEWRADTRQVYIWRGAENMTLTIGSKTVSSETGVSGNTEIDVPPQIINGRTMVPLAAVLTPFGFGVNWDGATNTVTVTDSWQSASSSVSPSAPVTTLPAPVPEAAVSPRQIAEAVIASQNGIPGLVSLPHTDTAFNEYLTETYRISLGAVSGGVISYVDFSLVDNMPADEIAVFELAPGADSGEVAAALKDYIQRRASQFAGYAPDSAAVASNGVVVYRDNFVAMLICSDPQAAESAFLEFFR